MNKRIFSLYIGLFLMALLLVLMTAEESEADIITVPGDYSTIQAGYNNCNDGDRLDIASGDYHLINLTVEKEIDIVGVGSTTNISGNGFEPVFNIIHDNVTIQYLSVYGAGADGIKINCNDTELFHVTIVSNDLSGVNISGGYRHVIRSCNISSNLWYGVYANNYYTDVPMGNFNMINNDIFTNEREGIIIEGANHTQVASNNISNNYATAIAFRYSNNLSISNNDIYTNNGNAIYMDLYCHDSTIFDNVIVNNGGSGVYSRYGDRINIYDNYIYSGLQGIFIMISEGCNISSNEIYSVSAWGIGISQSSYIDVYDNYVNQSAYGDLAMNIADHISITYNTFEDSGSGIKFHILSNNCTFIGNTIYNNATPSYLFQGQVFGKDITISDNVFYSNADYGVSIQNGDRWVISNNQFIGEIGTTIYLFASDYIEISDCHFKNNTIGAHLMYANNCTLYDNTFEDCTLGLKLDIYCYDTWIYNNQFINNTIHAEDGINTIWYNQTTLRGNFWDTYTGYDLDGDGVGDTETPYLYDPYPLTDNVPPPTLADILYMVEFVGLFTFLILIGIVIKFKRKIK